MSRGGEPLEDVIGRKEEAELPEFQGGAFELDGGDYFRGEERVLASQEFLDRFVPAGEVQRHTMRALFGSIRVLGGKDFECREVTIFFNLKLMRLSAFASPDLNVFMGLCDLGILFDTDFRTKFVGFWSLCSSISAVF